MTFTAIGREAEARDYEDVHRNTATTGTHHKLEGCAIYSTVALLDWAFPSGLFVNRAALMFGYVLSVWAPYIWQRRTYIAIYSERKETARYGILGLERGDSLNTER